VVQQRPGVTGKPVRLAHPPSLLAGREDLLADLHTRLTGGDGPGPRTVALCGFGGAGKTSVALAYAHRHLAEVGVAWQLAAEDRTVLADGFGQLAAQLGARDVVDTRDPVASVHGVLAAFPHAWLLIFDNAPDRASVEAFLPPAGPGRVLITSQSALWSRGQALEVQVLDTEVAAGFLVDRTGDPDRQAATDLASTLGGLPLALEQAAGYIQATGISLAGYLASFVQRRPELLSRGEPTGYPQTVATTWRLAFEDLQRAAPGAVGLLRLLAFCAPEAVPLRLLLQPRPGLAGRLGEQVAPVLAPLMEDRLAAGDAITALRRYSLISPPADGSVSVHRLVQAVTADQMPAELAQAWQHAAAALIENAIPGDPEPPETWPACAALLPHAQAALTDDSAGMARIANYLGASGSYAPARDLQQKVVEAREQVLGPEHPQTLNARGDLAGWTGQAGDAAAARDQYAALLPVIERVLGPEHPAALTARKNFAEWTGNAGDLAGARDMLIALVPAAMRALGPEHPHTLLARSHLAYWVGEAGNPAEARDHYADLIPVEERVLGPEHPDVLIGRSQFARFIGEAGDPAGARAAYGALVLTDVRMFGPEHPRTLTARANLADWTGQAGDAAAARDLLAALLPVRERVLGPEHPATLTNRGNLADWTGEAGDAAAARDEYAELLPVRERVLGPEHPYTLATRHNLAHWNGEAGDAAAARDQFAALVPLVERVQGAEHPDTLHARNDLVYWTERAERGSGKA
jgi:hypothetical protein